MALRILVIDDHAEFRTLLRHHISLRWPWAEIDEHDPVTAGPMPSDFSGDGYNLVLLDYQLGIPQDGFMHLKRFRSHEDFPPVIMLTASGNEELAVQAIKGGAADYIPKQAMTHERLTSAMQTALDSRAGHASKAGPPGSLNLPPPTDLTVMGYHLVRRIAEGGSGTIYLARQQKPPRDVAIKVMAQRLPTGEESQEALRLQREYELIRQVDSPRIVRLHEIGLADGHVFLAMEYFPHGSLREVLMGPIPKELALSYLDQIATALEIIHRAGIIHRDLKPANLMLREDESLTLIDFGTAKQLGQNVTLTRMGSVTGTPHYMSPEQCAGLELTPASDLYAAGIILFEMLTGNMPYIAGTPLAVLYKHQYAPLPQLPPALAPQQHLLDALLAKEPARRMQHARELRQYLKTMGV